MRFDTGGRYFAASCPKGNLISFWDASEGTLLHTTRARDGCGVCAVQDGFVFSTGTGRVAQIDLAENEITELDTDADLAQLFWDNHISAVQS